VLRLKRQFPQVAFPLNVVPNAAYDQRLESVHDICLTEVEMMNLQAWFYQKRVYQLLEARKRTTKVLVDLIYEQEIKRFDYKALQMTWLGEGHFSVVYGCELMIAKVISDCCGHCFLNRFHLF
jgi:hypothetical protein